MCPQTRQRVARRPWLSDTSPVSRPQWHTLSPDETLRLLSSTEDTGLTSADAKERLAKHGPNLLQRHQSEGPLVILWRQINNPLIWVLNGSAALAMALGKVTDGAVVLAVVAINTLIGFFQEFRASKAIEALLDMVPESATVLRDGKRCNLPVADLVPGDIIFLSSGDKVSADVRLIRSRNLQVQEAALTGESVPSQKSASAVDADAGIGDRKCLGFGGTLVVSGAATAVVIATGQQTELGRISTMLKEATDLQTPMTKALASIGKAITVGVLVVSMVMVAIGVARMMSAGIALGAALQETLIFAIALAVGAIPEGLPAIVTIALAIGVQRMAARQAIVRKLPAVETLGSTTSICTDKTGTLTRNEMTVQALWTADGSYEVTGVGYEPSGELTRDGKPVESVPQTLRELLVDGVLCNDATLANDNGAWSISGDPTEGALITAAMKLGVDVAQQRAERARIDVIPFESENQFMATLHRATEDSVRVVLKGAPEVVLRRCGASEQTRTAVASAVEALTAKGMRVLAVASKVLPTPMNDLEQEHVTDGMQLVGLQAMIDPPRREAVEAVKACHAAGIAVRMITGDHQGTAVAIGKQLGLVDERGRAVTGADIEAASDVELEQLAQEHHVFARVAPEHKLRLVRALQARDEVVAMTGDGVNDAPALKQANIGVAMGITGTAVSKEAADIILTDDNFASIEAAVEEGRRVYDNLVKSLAFVLPTNLGLALILICAVAFFPFNPVNDELLLPISPVQLLWINLVATVSLALPLAFEAKEPDVMQRPPRSPKEPVLNRFVISRTILVAILMTAGAIGLFLYEHDKNTSSDVMAAQALAQAQTMVVTTVIFFQGFYVMNCRSLKGSVFSIGLFSNPWVFVGAAIVLLLQAAFIFLPILNRIFGSSSIGVADIALAALVGSSILPVVSLEKRLRRRSEAAAPRP